MSAIGMIKSCTNQLKSIGENNNPQNHISETKDAVIMGKVPVPAQLTTSPNYMHNPVDFSIFKNKTISTTKNRNQPLPSEIINEIIQNLIENNTDLCNIYRIKECVGKGNFGDVYRASLRTENCTATLNFNNGKTFNKAALTAKTHNYEPESYATQNSLNNTKEYTFESVNETAQKNITVIPKNVDVAIKIVDLEESEDEIELLAQEIYFLGSLKNKHIVSYFQTLLNDVKMWIVMEYCGGGSCADLLKYLPSNLTEEKVSCIIKQTLLGLEYLHAQKKIHRDIKAANILLAEDGTVKLGDFGVSGELMNTIKRRTFVGTPFWMAPEIITCNNRFIDQLEENGNGESGKDSTTDADDKNNLGYNEKADIWSLGITVIELLSKHPPFSEEDPLKILTLIPDREPPVLQDSASMKFSLYAKEFVSLCLRKDPRKRPSASQLLKHKFITKLNKKNNVSLVEEIEYVKKIKQNQAHRKEPKFNLNDKVYKTGKKKGLVTWKFDVDSLKRDRVFAGVSNINSPNDKNNDTAKMRSDSISPYRGEEENKTPRTHEESPASFNAKKYNLQKKGVSSTIPVQMDQEQQPQKKKQEVNYYKDIIECSFKRLNERARYQQTKKVVENLNSCFKSAEHEQPGLSEALIEEIMLCMENI
ncbi:putative serine/threonine protein kinase SPS1 SCDLUD_003827 [Saccharomycodes ludwigii]|uniref:putative serine/threonine protein kinase SPS1 n=1 Tax=Saccharomycodes ludwigii TaxID=36035 RepID=UPI001E8B0A7F|nr:hypothetical protein SCDLUD_003827 [Saccharomycodes ludwigii]KAH3899550.1 hypothetical protein SCDLUD_003827 [Saccharomycodes ludwigii]